eukprot:5238839-Alexandrium_andersonii.AAC.1
MAPAQCCLGQPIQHEHVGEGGARRVKPVRRPPDHGRLAPWARADPHRQVHWAAPQNCLQAGA